MKKYISLVSFSFIFTFLFVNSTNAQQSKVVGGAEMLPSKNIIENAANSKDHTILVKAVHIAEMEDQLKSEGPFTVFAPTNDAFELQPDELVNQLLTSKETENLQAILSYHVLPKSYTTKELKKLVRKSDGGAKLVTVNGDQLLFNISKRKLIITDFYGNKSAITIPDVAQSNGVIHVVNGLMIPKFSF